MERKSTLLMSVGLLYAMLKGSYSSNAETRLQNYLFTDYNKYVRPVINISDAVHLHIGLSITQLLDVDEKNQIITTGVWMNQWWVDYRLTWKPVDYDGMEFVVVPFEWVWYPDIVLDNSADGNYELPTWKYTSVMSDGTVWVTPPGVLKSPCAINVQYFPFDIQECPLSFGPWEFTALQVRLFPIENYVVIENYVENVEWELANSSVEEIYEANECCPDEAYSVALYTLVLRRRPLFYVLNILVPCLVMSLLTLVVFYLPSDCGEKMTLSISVLLAISVFNLLIFDIMPPTSDTIPLIGKYLLFNMALVMFSIMLSVLVLNLHHRCMRTYRMPQGLRKLFLYRIPPYVFLMPYPFDANKLRADYMMECEKEDVADASTKGANRFAFRVNSMAASENFGYRTEEKDATHNFNSGMPLRTLSCRLTTHGRFKRSPPSHRSTIVNFDKSVQTNGSLPQELDPKHLSTHFHMAPSTDSRRDFEQALLEEMEFITRRLKFDDWDYEVREEWKYIAMVVDRICLIAFFLVFLTGTCTIIFSAPNLLR
ncbi:neuronal acetylcholine receptor subunit beta-4-like [Glandiceps talaboti]